MNSDAQKQSLHKVAHDSGFIGQDGINLIATIVGTMRHLWTPTSGQSDVGIDGYIELCRDTEDGKRVATNFIIQVQSKATHSSWSREDENGFVYNVDEKDLRHWLAGNHPVILIVSRPPTGEAYWIPVKDYFTSFEAKKTRTIYFKKNIHGFDKNADTALNKLAIPASTGLKTQPLRKNEALESNLLPLLSYPKLIYGAKTRFNSLYAIREKAKKLGAYPGREWFCKSRQVFSFLRLDQYPWTTLTVGKPFDPISSDIWANSEDPVEYRDFVRLLNEALAGVLAGRGLWRVKLQRRKVLYFFAPGVDTIERVEKWGERENKRTVVQSVLSKKDPTRVVCYRHQALIPQFERFGGKWYLVLEPSYYFTTDGQREYPLREEYLAGIKRLERHQAVRNNVRFWAHVLTHRDLFDERRELLAFQLPLQFQTDFGIPDPDWLSNADAEERERVGVEDEEISKRIVADREQLSLIHEA